MPPGVSVSATVVPCSPPPASMGSSSDNSDNSDSESSSRGSGIEDGPPPLLPPDGTVVNRPSTAADKGIYVANLISQTVINLIYLQLFL